MLCLTFLQASYPLVVSTQVMSGNGDIPAVYCALLTFLQASYPLVVSTQVMSGNDECTCCLLCPPDLPAGLVVSTQVMSDDGDDDNDDDR